MTARKKYRDSLLSILCVISWFVMVFRIFKSRNDDRLAIDLALTYLMTIGVGVIGGIILIFVRLLKKRNLKYHFIYNLFGTFNIIIGFLGLALFALGINPAPYTVTACFGVGLVIYKDIYRREISSPVRQ